MNVETAGHAGTLQSKQLNTESIDMFRHPNYYKELRKLRNELDQAISSESGTPPNERATGPGPKQQASSVKLLEHQATSVKPFAASVKLEATSIKLPDPRTTEKFHGTRTEVLNADEGVVRMAYVERYLVW